MSQRGPLCAAAANHNMIDVAPETGAQVASDFSLLQLSNPDVLANPYPLYRAMREHDPVHWDHSIHSWVVTSYEDVVTVLANYSAQRTPTPVDLTRKEVSVMEPFAEVLAKQMLFMDGASHTRLRTLCSEAFAPRRIAKLRSSIETIVKRLIDRVATAGSMDVIADLANSFPAMVAAALLGFPMSDHVQLKKWTTDFADLLGNFEHNPNRAKEVPHGGRVRWSAPDR
jgi:pimeloyl-[acyl-carrier protein] synthase